jgi:hypothetical protein
MAFIGQTAQRRRGRLRGQGGSHRATTRRATNWANYTTRASANAACHRHWIPTTTRDTTEAE